MTHLSIRSVSPEMRPFIIEDHSLGDALEQNVVILSADQNSEDFLKRCVCSSCSHPETARGKKVCWVCIMAGIHYSNRTYPCKERMLAHIKAK